MNEDLHKEDEHFKSAYRRLEEEPSPDVWDKINSRLDRQDMIYYRKKLVTWKRIACVLLLLLGSFFMYENFFTVKQGKLLNAASGNDTLGTLSNRTGDSTLSVKSNKNTSKINTLGAPKKLNVPQDYNNADNYNRDHQEDIIADKKAQAKQQTPQIRSLFFRHPMTLQNSNSGFLKKPEFHIPFDIRPGALIKEDSASDFNNNTIEPNDRNKESNVQDENGSLAGVDKNGLTAIGHQPGIIYSDSPLNTQVKKKKNESLFKPYWSFTTYASADFTHYKLDDDIADNGIDPEDKNEIEGREAHEFSFSSGILARWQHSKYISFKTGLIYSDIAIGIQPQTLYATRDNNQNITYKFITSSGYAYLKPVFGDVPAAGDSISSNIAQHHLHYFYIPVMLNYAVHAGKRFSIAPGAGISTNILLSTKVETDLTDEIKKEHVIINKLQGLRPFYLSFITDAEIQFNINKHLNFTLLPTFKYAINPITKNNVVKTYPYSLGLGAGITCYF